MSTRLHVPLLSIGSTALLVSLAMAQCTTASAATGGYPGTNGSGTIEACYLPAGPGHPNPRLAVGGIFTAAGSVQTNNLAALDLVTGEWSGFGSGADSFVNALTRTANGDLVIGGVFLNVDGTAAPRVARWDGAAWSSIGGGVNGEVYEVTALASGHLAVGGVMTSAGGVPANRIAIWDGASWSALGSGCNAPVHVILELPNGDLVVGGEFTTAGGIAASRVARWDGLTWHPMDAGLPGAVFDLSVAPNGDVLASGMSAFVGSAYTSGLARWDGAAWQDISVPGFAGLMTRLHTTLTNGDLVTVASNGTLANLFRWDGVSWSPIASFDPQQYPTSLLPLPNGELAVSGWFHAIGGNIGNHVAIWNGTSFETPDGGLDPVCFAIGAPKAGSSSTAAVFGTGGVPWPRTRNAARLGTTWLDLGLAGGDTYAMLVANDGSVVGGGTFTVLGGAPATHVAKRAGSTWQPLGTGVNNSVYALAELPNGDVVAGGAFTTAGGTPANRIARWDGSAWHAMGTGMDSDVYALTFVADANSPNGGTLFAGGLFSTAGGVAASCLAAWNGTSWQPVAGGTNNSVHALCTTDTGELIAGGVFTAAGGNPVSRVARLVGGTWTACGAGTSGPVFALAPIPGGGFLAGGSFTTAGATTVNNLARWNGSTWSGFGSGTDASVMALATMPNGDVWAGGYFTMVDGQPSLHVARITTTCPASATPFLAGCPSSGGANVLSAATMPWVDATFTASGTGLPPFAIVLTLTSLTAFPQGALPLSLVFSQAGPGCDVLVAPDILSALTTTTGSVTSSMFLPNVPPLVGVTFYHQLLPFELGPGGFTAITATNALQLTAGSF